LSEGFWIGLQTDYDAAKASDALARTLAKIKPWSGRAVHGGTAA